MRLSFLRTLAAVGLLLSTAQAQDAARKVAPVLLISPNARGGTLLGAWDGRRWLRVAAAVPLVQPGTVYSTRGLSGPASRVVGGRPESYGAPCPDAYGVPLTPAPVAVRRELATAAGIRARPRPVTAVTALTVLPIHNAAYEQVVRAELQRRGLKTPVVQLRSVTRADLDGDGRDEVIIEATHFAGPGAAQVAPPPEAQPGDSSLLLLRWASGGQAHTTALGADVVLRAGTPASSRLASSRLGLRFQLEGIADLNGDGRMELVTSQSYYEGDSEFAFTWTPAQGPKQVLETGCGA